MNDQTRGDTPGTDSGLDVPLKRDRKRLRSPEPLPERTPPARQPAPTPAEPEELLEPSPTPVEQLFAGSFSTPAISVPDALVAPDSDQLDREAPAPTEAEPEGRRFGLNFARRRPAAPEETAHAPQEPDAGEPPAPASPVNQVSADTGRARVEPYVPPGGFSGPGHPRLGPLAPAPLKPHPGLARLDVAAIVAAVILPPVGLVTAIVALIRGKQVRGWASDLARAAVSVSVVMTLVFAGVGAYVWITETENAEQLAVVKAEQRAHDRVAAASAPFCEVLAANPTIYSTADPDYGWPALDAPAGYNTAIAEYAAVWAQLATVAPEGIAAETAAISERVAGIVNIANALGAENRAGDLLTFHAADDLATVESWYVEYCNPPKIPAE